MYDHNRITSNERKEGVMNDQLSSLPYSRKGLQALQEALALHSQMYVWLNPATNEIALRQVPQASRPTLVSTHKD